jgi:signal transduction histidine kinase
MSGVAGGARASRVKRFFAGIAGRTLTLALGSILSFAAVIAILLFFGTGKILSSWHDNEASALDSFIEDRLAALSERTSEAVSGALADIPFNPSYVAVADAGGELLYFRRGGMGSMGGMPMRGRLMQGIQGMKDIAEWKVVRAGGGVAFRYSAAIPSFDESESNRLLLGAAEIILVRALAIGAAVALAFALAFARPIRRQTSALAKAIARMASGERDVGFATCSVAELDEIARAASVLQTGLGREETLRRQWAADVAHDLRTPLASLRCQIDGITDGVFAPDADRLSRLASELSRLEALTASLSLLTRLESPGFAPDKKRIDLASFLEATAARFSPEAGATGSRVRVDCAGGAILADEGLLGRAVDNVVSNAVRYGKAGGDVVIAGVADDGSGNSAITVENAGVIDGATLARAFDRLYRADSSRGTDGSGLGLSIAKAIAEAHGGAIRGEADAARDATRFAISIPV